MLKFGLLCLIGFLIMGGTSLADDAIVQLNVEGESTSEVPIKARADSLKDALNKGGLQVIQNLLGVSKLEKNQSLVNSRILSQTGKFVQFYKATEPAVKGNTTVTLVNMKISVTSLKDLLAQEGLLYQMEGPPTILPFFKLIEKKDGGARFSWWVDEVSPQTQFLRDQEKSVLHSFDSIFRPKNFYVIDPLASHYVQWIPTSYRSENLPQDQLLWLGEYFKAQIVAVGEGVLEPASTPEGNVIKLSVRLTGYHTSNGRVVGEVTRSFDTPLKDWSDDVGGVLKKGFTEAGKDLASQILDESTKGTLGATLIRLTLKGSYNYQDLENFKKQIVIKVGDVKTIRERRQEKGATTFEVDYSGALPTLVKTLENMSFDGFKLGVVSSDGNEAVARWTKVGK